MGSPGDRVETGPVLYSQSNGFDHTLDWGTEPFHSLHLRRVSSKKIEELTAPVATEDLRTTGGPSYGSARRFNGGQWEIDLHDLVRFQADIAKPEIDAFAQPDVSDHKVLQEFLDTAAVLLLPFYGWECLHASAVMANDRVIAFCGDREAGKSSLAAAAMTRGADRYGDDALAFASVDDGMVAARLPQKLRPREPARSALRANESVSLPVPEMNGSTWKLHLRRDALPISAIYLLGERYDDRSKPPWIVEEVSPSDKLHSLLSEAHCLTLKDERRKRDLAARFMTLSASVPVFRLRMQEDVAVLPSVARFLLESEPVQFESQVR